MTLELPKQSESQAFGTLFLSATTTHRNNIEVPTLAIGSYRKRSTYEGNSEGKRTDWSSPVKTIVRLLLRGFVLARRRNTKQEFKLIKGVCGCYIPNQICK